MLTFKRYKQLKARRKDLTDLNISGKIYMKFYQRSKFFSMSDGFRRSISKNNIELNYINEILRMHKILWKQHLAAQPKPIVAPQIVITCGSCSTPCLQEWCCTSAKNA